MEEKKKEKRKKKVIDKKGDFLLFSRGRFSFVRFSMDRNPRYLAFAARFKITLFNLGSRIILERERKKRKEKKERDKDRGRREEEEKNRKKRKRKKRERKGTKNASFSHISIF